MVNATAGFPSVAGTVGAGIRLYRRPHRRLRVVRQSDSALNTTIKRIDQLLLEGARRADGRYADNDSVTALGSSPECSEDEADVATRTPRVLLAGDACHTHTAKAGQGMNVSMADTYNLGWKLVAVLQDRSPASLLHTYNHERHGIAEDLIAMDTRWSKAIGAAQVDPSKPEAALIGLAEVQRQFITNLDFTAGLATDYDLGPITGDNTHLHLAAGYEPGRRFHSAEVIRLSDAKRLQLGHVHRADGRWRLYAFADAVDPRNPASRLNKLMDFLAGPNSPVATYTPKGWDADAVFDVRAILQQRHLELDWVQMHKFLKPKTGPLDLIDYEKVFCPLADTDQDIFDLRQIDRGSGALVVVRPDQYVALTLPLDGYDELDEFFARFMQRH